MQSKCDIPASYFSQHLTWYLNMVVVVVVVVAVVVAAGLQNWIPQMEVI